MFVCCKPVQHEFKSKLIAASYKSKQKAGEMEKSVILLVTAGHGSHLINILLQHNCRLDVVQSFLTRVACWIVAAKKKEKKVECDLMTDHWRDSNLNMTAHLKI